MIAIAVFQQNKLHTTELLNTWQSNSFSVRCCLILHINNESCLNKYLRAILLTAYTGMKTRNLLNWISSKQAEGQPAEGIFSSQWWRKIHKQDRDSISLESIPQIPGFIDLKYLNVLHFTYLFHLEATRYKFSN